MKKQLSALWLSLLTALSLGMVFYCERGQMYPQGAKKLWISLCGCGLLLTVLGFCFFLRFFLPRLARICPKGRWILLLLCCIGAVCCMVWLPMPATGLWASHELTVTAEEEVPFTLTWLSTDLGDVSFSAVSGDVERDDRGLTGTSLRWNGTPGTQAVIEFAADPNAGAVRVAWDGVEQSLSLNHGEMDRLSFAFAFPPAHGLWEFLSVFYLLTILLLTIGMCWLQWDGQKHGQALFMVLWISFAVFRLCQFRTAEGPLFFVDSESYIGVSEMSWGDIVRAEPFCYPEEDLWYCISRPALIPMVYKLCSQNLDRIAWVQLGFSVICWIYAACCLRRVLRNPKLGLLAAALLLGLGSVPNVTRWDLMIMTESITIALAMGFFGSCLLLTDSRVKGWRVAPTLMTVLFGGLLLPTRDSSAWLILLSGALFLFLSASPILRKRTLTVALCLIGLSLSSMMSTDDRWQFPFENVLFARILRDPAATEFFIHAGMPMPIGIETLYGTEHLQSSALFHSVEYEPLREWILTDGLGVYVRYMFRVPMETLRMTWYAGFEREAFEEIGYFYTPFGFRSLLPDSIVKLLSFNVPGIGVISLGLYGLVQGFKRKRGSLWAFPVMILLTVYPLVCAVLLIDTYDFARHAIVNVILLKAAAWTILFLAADGSREDVEPIMAPAIPDPI